MDIFIFSIWMWCPHLVGPGGGGVCIFDKGFARFWHLAHQNLHKNKMHIILHVRFRYWHIVWLVKKKTTCQLTIYQSKWHVLLSMWHWGDNIEKNVDVNWHLIFVLKTSRDTLDLKLNIKWNLSNIHTSSTNHYGHLK